MDDAAEILDAYPCASPTCQAEQCILGRRIRELEAERAQAAPVLAAAEVWLEAGSWSEAENVLRDAIAAWRAAREG